MDQVFSRRSDVARQGFANCVLRVLEAPQVATGALGYLPWELTRVESRLHLSPAKPAGLLLDSGPQMWCFSANESAHTNKTCENR